MHWRQKANAQQQPGPVEGGRLMPWPRWNHRTGAWTLPLWERAGQNSRLPVCQHGLLKGGGAGWEGLTGPTRGRTEQTFEEVSD